MPRTFTAYALIVIMAAFSFLVFKDASAADLLASWVAGHFYQTGALDQIYPSDTNIYSMQPPDAWISYLTEQGYKGQIFPFIYPPLWAHVFGWLTTVTSFQTISLWGRVINPVLLGITLLLAQRVSGSTMSTTRYVVTGIIILAFTSIGSLAVYQNQPQIFVSFLIVLAIERSRNNSPIAAGIALALAASIKLYPALFAIFWLASGDRKAFASFLVAGLVLGGVSVLLAGWPLHESFLHEVSLINSTVMLTKVSLTLDGVFGQLFLGDYMQHITVSTIPPSPDGAPGWYVLEKSTPWKLASAVGIALSIFVIFRIIRKHPAGTAPHDLAWPLAIILIALFNPISWSFHYLPAVVFAPALLDYYGTRVGVALLTLVFLPLSMPLLVFNIFNYPDFGWIKGPSQIAATAGIIGLAILFALAMRRKPRKSHMPDPI